MERDIITLASFPKSGVTYLSSLLYYSLFPEEQDPRSIEEKFIVDVHAHPRSIPAKYEGLKFIKSHSPFNTEDVYVKTGLKCIYLIRDPIDVMSSAYDFEKFIGNKERKPFAEYVDSWIATGGAGFEVAGTWIDHVRSWNEQDFMPTLRVKYTDLVDYPKEQLARIFAFCEIHPAEDDVAKAIEKSTMTAMRAREEEEFASKTEGVFYSKSREDSMSQGARFINKGYRGSASRLSTDQRKAADELFGPLSEKYI